MATRSTSSDFTNASDAQFRAWGKWFRDCFSAAGWTLEVETFGTGTNWTDVTAPSAGNQVRVTTIWALADAAQATSPLFIKVEIGSGSATNNPGYRLTLGTGRSGSTITGILIDTTSTHLTATATTQVMNHYSGGDTDRVTIAMSVSGTSWAVGQMLVLNIERRKDGSGANDTNGFLLAYLSSGGRVTRAFTATSAGPNARAVWVGPIWGGSAAFGGVTPVAPVCYDMGQVEIGLGMVNFLNAAFSVGAEFDCTVLGASHHYLCTQIQADGFDGPSTNHRAAIRYE